MAADFTNDNRLAGFKPKELEEGSSMESDIDVGLVKQTLAWLASHRVILTTTRAQKLFYLIERQCVIDTGKRCFSLDFRSDRYGMYSPTLDRIFKRLTPKEDHLELRDIVSDRGQGRAIRWVGRAEGPPLPAPLERAIKVVLGKWGFLETPALLEKAKKTSPFIYAKKGEYLNWNILVEGRCQEDEELSEEGERRLRESEEDLRQGRHRTFKDVEEFLAELSS